MRLFVERVRDVQPDFRLTTANGPTVTAICRRLDALPLALELAAPWIKVLTAEDLLRRLEHDVLLSTVRPARSPRTPTDDECDGRLELPAARPARAARCSVVSARCRVDFRSRQPRRCLSVVTSRQARTPTRCARVAGLIDKSLLLRAETSVATRPLYQMLETVRAFAALELADAGERDDALDGLARYCIGEASLAAEGLVGSAQVEWLDRVRDDLESYRAALSWLIERGRAIEASDIASGLTIFWAIRGHAAEGLWWYEQILNLPSVPPAAESRVLNGAALMWYTQGELGRARTALERALALARSVGDIGLVAQAENLLGHVEQAVGNVNAARDQFTRSVEAFQSAGDPVGCWQWR